jgi:hypothetical protein
MKMKTPLEFRPFSRFDWKAFCGAEPFPRCGVGLYTSGPHEPLIASIHVGLREGVAIVDSSGLAVHWSGTEAGEDFVIHFPAVSALRALALLGAETTRGVLLALGGIES